jgi:hypothetical protein
MFTLFLLTFSCLLPSEDGVQDSPHDLPADLGAGGAGCALPITNKIIAGLDHTKVNKHLLRVALAHLLHNALEATPTMCTLPTSR